MAPKAIIRDFPGSFLETYPSYGLESNGLGSTTGGARFESQFAGLEATIFLTCFTSEETSSLSRGVCPSSGEASLIRLCYRSSLQGSSSLSVRCTVKLLRIPLVLLRR
jgi:hypothetical protein